MTRILCACFLLLGFTTPGTAQPSLKSARERWLRGNYEESLAVYEKVAKDEKLKSAVAVGISRIHQSQGEYDKALEVVDTALKNTPKDADLLARMAELLYFRGRWEEAEKTANAAIAVEKDQFAAHWVRAQVFRDRGELKKGDDECLWFVRAYNRIENIKDPETLLFIGLASAEHARYARLADEFETILNDLYGDALKNDPSFWPVEYEAGVLLLEKYNRPEAVASFDKALTINPSAAEALAGKGVAAFMKLDLKEAEGYADRALKANPNLPAALRLRADLHLFVGDFTAAQRELEKAQKINPRDEETLARLAACLRGLRKDDEFAALAKSVEGFDKLPAVFWYELGEQTEVRRLFSDAEKYFKKAAELRPTLPGPLNNLGLLYMRMGREKEAAELLDKGFNADKFNVRVSNMRKVLKHLGNYATLKTEHFELRYDAKRDGPLARYMAEQLEAIYAELAKTFNHSPKGPILIEVFNSHEMFSGRVVAVPDLHTIGACTGRMIAMASPHAAGIRQPFNWARVLRHEIVHIFNLDQTDYQVPHWLTEGLAVQNEGFPRPQPWNALLLERVPAGELMDLDNINLGFMRPKTPADWHMAYCQSLLYVQYIQEKYGAKAIGELLAAYKDGLDTSAAIRRVCKVGKAEFEKGYRAYLDAEVKKIKGKPAEKKKTYAELKKAHENNPRDADAAAEFAMAALDRSDRIEARKAAESANDLMKDKTGHPLASVVLARLERVAGNVKKEKEILEAAYKANKDNPDVRLLKAYAKVCYEGEDFKKAAEVLEDGRKTEPNDNEWLQQLSRVYARSGDRDKLIAVLKDLVPTDADQLDWRKRLARLLLDKEDFAGAETYARQGLEIDVADPEVQEMLQKALKGQKKNDEAERLAKLLAK